MGWLIPLTIALILFLVAMQRGAHQIAYYDSIADWRQIPEPSTGKPLSGGTLTGQMELIIGSGAETNTLPDPGQ